MSRPFLLQELRSILPRLALEYERRDNMRLTGGEPAVCRESQVYLRAVMDAAKRPVKFPQFQIVYSVYGGDKIKSYQKILDDVMLPGVLCFSACCLGGSETSSVRRSRRCGVPRSPQMPVRHWHHWQQNLATEPGNRTWQQNQAPTRVSHICVITCMQDDCDVAIW